MLSNEHLKLNVCECGHLHLTYKGVTLHFDKEEFLHYAAHLGHMAIQVSCASRSAQSKGLPERFSSTCH